MYPVHYEADFQSEQNRATTFFRIILAIPWLIVGYVYEIAAFFTQVVAWFALLFTGKYPEGLYKLNAGFVRYRIRTLRLGLPADRRVAPVRHRRRPQLPDPGQRRRRAKSTRAGSRSSSGSSSRCRC